MHTFIHKAIPSVLFCCRSTGFHPLVLCPYWQICTEQLSRWFDHFAVRIRISNAVVY